MKKFLLLLFIFADLGVIAIAGVYIYSRVRGGVPAAGVLPTPMAHSHLNVSPFASIMPSTATSANTARTPAMPPAVSQPPAARPSVAQPSASPASSVAGPIEPGTRNIKFSYRNSKAKQVSIRADFTGWKAEPMHKDEQGVWAFQAALPPGEYAYCYTVDDKAIRDPFNKRTKQFGQTIVSAIVVTPAAGRAAH